jgi:EmrB/QacA subfamily drug resistance transporter
MAILAVTFKQGKERAQALGIWSSSFAAAIVFGPLLGGPLIDNFGWRSVFLINLPIGILGMIMAFIFINESRSEQKNTYFDWWGALTLGGMLSSLVLVLDQGYTWGWFSTKSLICYLAMIVFFAIFIKIEKKVPEPIVDLKFFKIPAFVNTLVNNFVVFMGMMGGVFLIPIFAQTFLGYTATQSGYLFVPMAAAMMMAAPIGGMLTGKVKTKYVIFASTIVAALGIFLLTGLDPKSSAWAIAVPLALMAFGLGFGMAQRTNVVASVVPESEIGIASSILALVRNISGAFGIAIFATILNNRVNTNVLTINSFSKITSHIPLDIQKYIALITLKAQIDAYNYVFLVSSIIVFLGAFTILFLKLENERTDIKVHVE